MEKIALKLTEWALSKKTTRVILSISSQTAKHCTPLMYIPQLQHWVVSDPLYKLNEGGAVMGYIIPKAQLNPYISSVIDRVIRNPLTHFRKISLLQIADHPSCHK